MPDLPGARAWRVALCLGLAGLLAAPAATAWSLQAELDQSPVPPAFAAWTTDLSPRAFPGNAASAVVSAIGCALGDVSGDGIADLVVLLADPATGVQRLQALAGPGFQQVIWEKASSLGQVLQCAPDLDLDGTLDPIVSTLGEATGAAAAGAVDQTRNQVQQVLDGASGAALVGRVGTEAVTGLATPVTGAATGAAQQATSALLPAAAGAAAFLQTQATTAALPIPAGLPVPPLPIEGITAVVTSAAELQVLDATGAVVATISIDEVGVQPLAIAPIPLTGGLPDVAVLTSALAPVQEAAAGVPELALYAADGTLAWATQLPASTGLPLLLPQAGDLNLDGVGDLIVTTVQQGIDTVPGAGYQVLSGVDGSILLESGPGVAGLMAALPLGGLPGGAAILEVAGPDTASSIALTALDGAGTVLWAIDVDALAAPVNAALDAHTGDITGFTDLTGDAVPDVAVAVRQGADLALQVINGLTGEVAWNATIPGVDAVVPVVVATASTLAGQGAGVIKLAEGTVEHARQGATSALLAVGTSATHATLALIDPATGAIQWVATAAVPAGADLASLSVDAAGDLDGDGVQDLLVTANVNGASADGAGDRAAASHAAGDGPGTAASVTAVSGSSGQTIYAASAEPGSELDFESDAQSAGATEEEDGDGRNGIPSPGPLVVAAALALGFVLRRRRA